jgi:hypothetical protein
MLTSPDFKDLLRVFGEYEVRFLVIGGYAVMRYTEPRFTKDLDLWIATNKRNAERVFAALRAFGAPLQDLSPDDFAQEGYFYQMGKPPFRLDIMMSIPGVEFESAWQHRDEAQIGELRVPFISRSDLILSKKAAGRPQDLIDAESLESTEQSHPEHLDQSAER